MYYYTRDWKTESSNDRETKLCMPNETDRFCLKSVSPLKPVGKEFIRSEVQIIPTQIKVIDYYREAYECRNYRKNGKHNYIGG